MECATNRCRGSSACASPNVSQAAMSRVTLLKDGDHRLSTPADLALLARTLDALTEAAAA